MRGCCERVANSPPLQMIQASRLSWSDGSFAVPRFVNRFRTSPHDFPDRGLLFVLGEIRACLRRAKQPQAGESLGPQLLVPFLVRDPDQFVVTSTCEEPDDDGKLGLAIGVRVEREELLAA